MGEKQDKALSKTDAGHDRDNAHFSSLAPRILSEEEFSPYVEEFDFVFSDANIRNIALAGQYGAGKSSVMRTFAQRDAKAHEPHHFLFVSLASFDEDGADKEDGNVDLDSEVVEKKILLQLVHQLDGKEAPKSRFSRTVDASKCCDLLTAIEAVAFVALSIVLLRWYGKPEISGPLFSRVVPCALLWLGILVAFVYKMIRSGSFVSLVRKLKVGNFEIDLEGDKNETPLDKYLDDLVYLINGSGYDVIVFEDLDRFGSVSLFQKLREINTIANATRKGTSTPLLRFFYLVRDGLFPDARDRTKFFDFIIPVVPFVDPSNAEAILATRLSDNGVEIDQTFLYQLSLFIDDPRVLDDIVNEFLHYKQAVLPKDKGRLNVDDYDRLLAMIAFKTVFPRDFELLQVGRGCLSALLKKRQWLVASLVSSRRQRLDEIDRDLESIGQHLLYVTDELTLLYGIGSLMQRGDSYYESWSTALRRDHPRDIIQYIRENDRMSAHFDSVAESLSSSNSEYLQRVQDAADNDNRISSQLTRERDNLLVEISQMERMSLSELLGKRGNTDAFFALEEGDFSRAEDYMQLKIPQMMSSTDYPLVRFLLMSGMIDDSYRRYTSFLHAGAIDPDDADLVIAILQGKQVEEDGAVHDPAAVIIRLDERELMKKAARNWALFAWLIKTDDNKIAAFLRGVTNDKDYEFVARYISSEQYDPRVFHALEAYPEITIAEIVWDWPVNLDLRRNACHRYMADCIDGDSSHMGGIDEDLAAKLGDFASTDPEFLKVSVVNPAMLVDRLESINYKPSSIDLGAAHGLLLDVVVDRGLFEPYAPLVDGLLGFHSGNGLPLSEGRLATAVFMMAGNRFYSAVEGDLSLFVQSMIEHAPNEGLLDDAEALQWLMTSDSISDELSASLAKVEHGAKLADVSLLCKQSRIEQAVDEDLAECNVRNVLGYIKSVNCLDARMVAFLDRNGLPDGLNAEACTDILGSQNAFADYAATYKGDLPLSRFQDIVTTCDGHYPQLDLTGIPSDRLSVLIELNCIEMNADNLVFMRANYPDNVFEFIELHFADYVEVVKQSGCALLNREETLALLSNATLPVDDRLALLDGMSGALRVDESYPDEINAKILEEHFDPRDLDVIADIYKDADPQLKSIIETRFAESVNPRTVRVRRFEAPLLAGVLQRMKDKDLARHLLLIHVAELKISVSQAQMKQCLRACELNAIADALDMSWKKIPKNEADDLVISTLVDMHMFTTKSKQEPDGSWRVYRQGL